MDRASLTEDEKWDAVVARDSTRDGEFVSAVYSTGIYCRPSCPARRPAREQVVFFTGPDEAEKAGFRACRRCNPREPASTRETELVDRVTKYIQANLERKLTLGNLAAQIGLSPYHLQRTFKRALGISPRQYVEARRLEKMKRSLRRGETVSNALYKAGFTSRSRVYEKVPSRLGVNPGTFRRGGEGLHIQYAIAESPIGRLLVGATERGVCAVCIGASDEAVEAALFEDYFAADISRNDDEMKKWVNVFANYFNGRRFPPDLPIDVRATAFQWRVWKEIQSIPYGATAAYSDIAKSLGSPHAARAVAGACATNPVSLLIPCHRVIGKDGGLHGYGWGIKRKLFLLLLERESNRRATNG
jgi:AraC family transcriptional regulator of adaptative response/methylated-DNA-[protein]-cysteine methyltransferase